MANMNNETLSNANGIVPDFRTSKEALEKKAMIAKNKVGAMASDLADTTTELYSSGRDYVKENPVKGMAIAAAVGAVAGSILTFALRGKSSKKH